MISKKLIVRRVATISISLALFLIYVVLGNLSIYGYIKQYHSFPRAMLVVTIIYCMGGCILQTLNKKKAVKILASLVFIILCIYLFYSKHVIDFVVFVICMAVVLFKSVNLCDPDIHEEN